MLRSRRLLALLMIAIAVGGFVGARALRTTTTAISASEAVDRYERSAPSERSVDSAGDESAAGVIEEPAAVAESDVDPEPAASATDTAVEPAVAEPTAASLPLPAPGVYPLSLSGSESLDLATGTGRTYPADAFLTVTEVDCGVDLRTDFVVERWQSIEFCQTSDGIELGVERIYHQFFGLDDLVVRACVDSRLSTEVERWFCEGETSVADRSVATEVSTRTVAGSERSVLVVETTLTLGDHPDNIELIELWIDLETGLPVYESRTYDFVLETPLGDAGYTEGYEWTLTSLESIG